MVPDPFHRCAEWNVLWVSAAPGCPVLPHWRAGLCWLCYSSSVTGWPGSLIILNDYLKECAALPSSPSTFSNSWESAPVHMPKPFLLGGNVETPQAYAQRQELGGPAGVCTLSVPAPSPSHRGKMDSSRWASDLDPVILVGSFQLRTFCHSAILICVLGTSHLCLQQAWPPSTGFGRAAPNPLLLSFLVTRTTLLHLWDSCP